MGVKFERAHTVRYLGTTPGQPQDPGKAIDQKFIMYTQLIRKQIPFYTVLIVGIGKQKVYFRS